MTFNLTSNNIERGKGGGVRNVIDEFSICFDECVFRWRSNFGGSVSSILQLLVALLEAHAVVYFEGFRDCLNMSSWVYDVLFNRMCVLPNLLL